MDKELMPYKDLLNRKGYRFTIQKQLVLKAIIQSNTHQNVKEIYNAVHDSRVGLATVYRNLKIFEQLDIVKEININGVSYYELKIFSGKPLHIHLKCSNCHRIIDMNDKNLALEYLKLNRKVEEISNFEIYDVNIMLMGLCKQCKEEKECQDQPNSDM